MEGRISPIEILLVEDNPGDARRLQMILKETSSFTIHVQNVDRLSKALEAIGQKSYDVILLDLDLPDSQGINTFDRMNQLAPTTAIIVLTGLSDDEVALRVMQRGAQDCLVKGEIDTGILTRSLRYAVERKRAEDALRESEERFHLANRATFNAIWDWNLQTNAIWWNENFQTLFGYRAEEIEETIESWTNRIHPEDLDRVTVNIHAAIDSGQQSWSDQYRFRHKDGTYAEIHDRGYIVREASGKPVRMVGAMQDITERKRAEERLRETKEYLQNLVDYANAPIIVWSLDFIITIFNHAFERLTGMSSEQVVGKPLEILFPKETKTNSMAFIRQTAIGERWEDVEIPIRGEDGSVRIVLWNSATLTSPDGVVIATIAQGQDITERKRAEEELHRTSDRLSLATRAGGVGVWDLDIINNKLTWDDQMFRLYGVQREHFGGAYETWKACVLPEDLQQGDAEVQMALRGEKEFDTEFRVLWPDGSIRHIHALALVQRDASGQPLRLVGTNQDITERKRAEEALRQAKDVLEVRVIERTRELNETNIQLEEEKEKLAVMLRSIGDGVIATDEHGTVVLLNQVAEELTGWRNDDALGLSLRKVFHIINESTKEECLDVVERVISISGIIGLANHTSLIAKDGQVRSITDSGAPI